MTRGGVVELHVPDFDRIRSYYEKLEFEVVWEREPEGKKGYLVMRLGDNVLCFWAGNDHVFDQAHFAEFPRDTPRGYGVEIVLMVDDIEEYYERVSSDATVVADLVRRPWGVRDFRVTDPAGFYLRFTEPYDVLDPAHAVQ